MYNKIIYHFPLIWVDLATFCTLLPLSLVFYSESLTNKLYFRWEVPVLGLSLSEVDYRLEMFKDHTNVCGFVVWSVQVLFNYYIVYYHMTKPHHPKFYSTWMNKLAMIAHMIGETIALFGFYLGAVLNMKEVCITAAAAGAFLHLPSVLWNNRNTHGQRELSCPSYFMTAVLLLTAYINFVLYDANYQTVFSCAMTINIYAMVRFYYILNRPNFANIEASYDRTLFFAGFSNFSFAHGIFSSLYFLLGFYTWNIYFNIIKPFPKFMMRQERGYWDVIPDSMEKKRGIVFEEELRRQMELEGDKREAIAKTLWNIIVGDESMMDTKYISELYEAWGMPDAKSAANATFKNVDLDNSGFIDYEEFKQGFKILIDGIFVIGEHESVTTQRQNLENKERDLQTLKEEYKAKKAARKESS